MTDRRLITLLIVVIVVSAAFLIWATWPASAKPMRSAPAVQEFLGDRWLHVAQGTTARELGHSLRERRGARARGSKRQRVPIPRPRPGDVSPLGSLIGGRPAGCPHRFCGCALSLHIFGRIVPHLNLAANWRAFHLTSPAPGMVAARHGHVFKLIAHRGGNVWQVWDANSGRGRIRIHDRSIAGYTIVNPHGA